MVLETGVVVAGTGYAGSAIARALASDPRDNAAYVLLDKAHGEMLLDIILSEKGEVAGALVARGGVVEPLKAPCVVLATGNVSGLFPGGSWVASGDGFAIAHRAGLALAPPLIVDHEGKRELRAGVPCKADGSTALPGLYVAGSVGSDRPDPSKLARAAIRFSRKGVDPMGPYRQQPAIDAPLPEGFADVKFQRLQAILARALSAEWSPERVKADEFARARVDLPLFSLQNACEVALLLLRDA